MKKSHVFMSVAAVALLIWALRQCRPATPPPPDVVPSVAFGVPAEGVQVGRDYNQRVLVAVKNSGPGIARLRLQADTLADLPSGFVGRGTDDWEVPDTVLEIPAGETWDAPLLVHANRAEKDAYELKLHATHLGKAAADAVLKVQVAKPKLELETSWLEPVNPADRARLQSVLRIRNAGAPVGDLTVHFESGGKRADHELHWSPVIEQARLLESESLDVIVGPQLYPGFAKLNGEIVLRGLNQEVRLPYAPAVPEGKAVYVTLSRTTEHSTNNGTRCTNTPRSSYQMPPTDGTPATSGFGSDGGGLVVSTPVPVKPMVPKKDEPPKDEDEEEGEDGDGFGFLGVDTPAPGTDSDTASTDDKDKDKKKKKDKKDLKEFTKGGSKDSKAKDDIKLTTLSGGGSSLDPGDLGRMAPLIKANDGLLANMGINTRAIGCGTMWLQDEEERKRRGLPPLPAPKKPDSLEGLKVPDFIKPPDTQTRVDDNKPTHLVRRESEDGTNLLDFSFGIQEGERKRVPIRINHPISAPRLGPSPVKNAPALAAYTKLNEAGGSVAELLEPASGKKIVLSPPGAKADSPVVVKNEGGVDAIHREDGELKRTHLKEDLSIQPVNAWPAGEKTGPILAAETRPDGKAVLLTRDAENKITLRQPEGVRELPGLDAALAFSGKEAMIALQNEDGSLAVVDAATGETRHSVAGSGHGAPSLMATKDGGMRLSYTHPMPPADAVPANAGGHDLGGHFASDYKDGKWSGPTRLFMPEEPVTNAAVAVEFTPPFAKAHYKPMDIGLSVNGRKVAEVKGRTPSGRYLYRVPVSELNYKTNDVEVAKGNEVTIDSKGIGPGNFHVSQKCSLYSLHDWKQGCFVAGSPQEADQLAQLSSHDVRHAAPDLVLASNGTELPRSLKPGESVEMQIGVFNAGDRTSKPGALQTLGNDTKNGEAQIPALAPFTGTQAKVKITAPQNWTPGTPLKLSVGAPTEGDGDPTTNQLDFYLFRDLDPGIAGPVRASSVDVKSLPADSIVEATAGDKARPFESPLRSNRLWFRSPVPDKGDMQIEITGTNASLVDRLDLFDGDGRAMQPQNGQWQAKGQHVYMRVGLPDGVNLVDGTQLKLWWE
ncbi:MAG: hypothetical protein ACO1TE_02560 [Prosthecobacter sp.]